MFQRFTPEQRQERIRKASMRLTYAAPSALRLVQGLALLVAAGTLLLWLPFAGADGGLTFGEAIFTATSAAAVTGLSIIVPAQDLSLFGQLSLLAIIQLGGVGFMMLAVFVQRILGRKVSLADRLALQDSLGLSLPRAIVRTAGQTLLGVLLIEGIGAVALWLHWRPLLGDVRGAYYGVFHAVSAFCNAGFDLFTGAPGFNGIPTDGVTLAIMAALIIAGGLGIPVWGDLIVRRGRLSTHSRVTLAVSASLIILGGVGLVIAEHRAGGTLAGQPFFTSAGQAFYQSISSRTAGFAALPDLGQLTPASQMLITALMFIGTAPASMGGGITTGTFAVVVVAMWSYVRGFSTARIGARSISAETGRRALAVLTMSIFLVGFTTWLLLMTQRITLDDALFTMVSAFATTGLDVGALDKINWFGRALIMGMMFWGRLGALTIVLAVARQSPPQPVTYPEAQLLIG